MIRQCRPQDFQSMLDIINDGAEAYRGIIPSECWREPYMSADELAGEIAEGVRFWGWEEVGQLAGVMGIQDVKDVALIRHAYVRTASRNRGIGGLLLKHLLSMTQRRVLIGTWRAAVWAISFYKKHGFRCVDEAEKKHLLRAYWNIPDRQVEASVVLVPVR